MSIFSTVLAAALGAVLIVVVVLLIVWAVRRGSKGTGTNPQRRPDVTPGQRGSSVGPEPGAGPGGGEPPVRP